jgi:hypothetical protein
MCTLCRWKPDPGGRKIMLTSIWGHVSCLKHVTLVMSRPIPRQYKVNNCSHRPGYRRGGKHWTETGKTSNWVLARSSHQVTGRKCRVDISGLTRLLSKKNIVSDLCQKSTLICFFFSGQVPLGKGQVWRLLSCSLLEIFLLPFTGSHKSFLHINSKLNFRQLSGQLTSMGYFLF